MAWLVLPVIAIFIALSFPTAPQQSLVVAQQRTLQAPASSSLLTQVLASQSSLVSQAVSVQHALTLCVASHMHSILATLAADPPTIFLHAVLMECNDLGCQPVSDSGQ